MDQALTAYREAGPGEPASPLKIQIMLACHLSSALEQWLPSQILSSPAGLAATHELFDEGLIDEFQMPTDKGRAWVEFICATPLPVRGKWVRP
jgi:hypothetical protein